MDNKDIHNLYENSAQYLSYETDKKITWCGNCGNYGIQNALMRALVLEKFKRKDFLLCYDVGCSGNGSDKWEANTIHGLHGRVLPLASGCALANEKIKIVASAGDGATFSEGVNHLVHAVRSNYNMIFIHHNNENYGLTTGQASSLTRCGVKMNGTPDGVLIDPINSLDFVLGLGPSFVARGYSGEVGQMTDLFREALKHKGFAFIEVLQACPTYNRETPDEWYQGRVRDISDLKGYDSTDVWAARKLVQDRDKDIYTGVLFEDKSKVDFLSMQKSRKGAKTQLVDEVKHVDVSKLW
jgi:2-oxoglutarate/2-oxoacid ferredoxin oxidoreductase subunit beta